MTRNMGKTGVRAAAVCGAVMLMATGCSKKADNTINYKNAINTYYSAHPVCLWDEAKKFPLQAETSDASKTSDYDALVDQGLLTRTTVEKKKLVVMTKQANNYDLSDKGRSAWTADTQQPGFGNFCYGKRTVDSIDSATPTNDQPGATTQIAYHSSISGAPDWAKAAETQTAFPELHSALATPVSGQATLTNTSNGWTVSSMPGATRHRTPSSEPPSSADGKIVK